MICRFWVSDFLFNFKFVNVMVVFDKAIFNRVGETSVMNFSGRNHSMAPNKRSFRAAWNFLLFPGTRFRMFVCEAIENHRWCRQVFFYILGVCWVFFFFGGGISAEFFLFKFQLSFYWTDRLTLPETSMTKKNQAFDDVSPINGDAPLSFWVKICQDRIPSCSRGHCCFLLGGWCRFDSDIRFSHQAMDHRDAT